jgi:hypothetical protein
MHVAPAAPSSPPRRLAPLSGPRSVAEGEGRAEAAGRFWNGSAGDDGERERAEEAIQGMSVAQLRGFISAAGLSFTDCLEKPDLVERAREAAATGAGAAASLFTPVPEPAPARKAAQTGGRRPGRAPAPEPTGARRSPQSNSSARSLFGQDGVKVGAGAAPNASRAPAPAFSTAAGPSPPPAAPPRLKRADLTAEFWREESGWKHAPLLNLVMHVRAAAMFAAGVGSFVLAQQATDDDAATAASHCDTLRRWIVVGSVCVALAGALAPIIWRKLRATKLERGVGAAKRLREKGFGNSRLGRSKDNAARHRGSIERFGGCVAFPVTVCFVGIQVVGFSAETGQCSTSLQNSALLFICCLYFVLCFQCVCIQSVQCSMWKELDLTLVDDEEADEEHDRSINRSVSGQHAPEP